MKKITALLAALLLAVAPLTVHIHAAEQTVSLELASQAAVLIDADTGQVLYGKNAYDRMYPASMTKIMTALLVVENSGPQEVMTVTASALEIEEPDSSNMSLQVGEQLTVEEALYGLMLPSANDAANVLAEHVAGSQQAFAQMMTQKAHEIGAVSTNFSNAHGLHEDDHYTTAYDMALITRYAMQNERFMDYFTATEYDMTPTNLYDERSFSTPHYMKLTDTNYYYEPVIGGKTGFTYEAMYTLSSAGSRDGRNLVTVVMHADIRADTFDDTRKLMEFGFNEFQPVTVSQQRFSDFTVPILEDGDAVGSVEFFADRDFSALVHTSVDPGNIQVNVQYDVPFTRDSSYECSVIIEAPMSVPGVPTMLGSFTLDAEVDLPPPVVVVAHESNFTDMLSGWVSKIKDDVFTIFLFLGAAVTGFLLLCLAIRSHNLKKRRRIRQQRLRQQRLREEARRRPPPSPQYGGVRPHVSASSHRARYASSSRR